MLQSQGIELLAFERISRRFSLMPATVDAKFMIDMQARRFSDSTGQILQAASVGVAKARLQFELVQPVGRLALQRYTVDLISRSGATEVEIEIYSRVFVPCRRVRFIQQMVCRITRQRILDELRMAIRDFSRELQAIASEKLPVGSTSLLFAAAGC